MSEASKVINGMMEQKLLNLHTAYFAKVISVNGDTAKIQPLNMVKATGKEAKKQTVLTVPILRNVRKYVGVHTYIINELKIEVPKYKPIETGDVVYCLCAERDITETKKGEFSIPPVGHHRISDSVIVGVI